MIESMIYAFDVISTFLIPQKSVCLQIKLFKQNFKLQYDYSKFKSTKFTLQKKFCVRN